MVTCFTFQAKGEAPKFGDTQMESGMKVKEFRGQVIDLKDQEYFNILS